MHFRHTGLCENNAKLSINPTRGAATSLYTVTFCFLTYLPDEPVITAS